MTSFSLSSSDSKGDITLDNDLQGSDDDETQSEGIVSELDDEHLPEDDSENSKNSVRQRGVSMCGSHGVSNEGVKVRKSGGARADQNSGSTCPALLNSSMTSIQ